jgi:branched-chain amino acid transport system permease protein
MSTTTVVLQQVLNALTLGSIYAMIAIGLAMIYGVLRVLHVAHAGVYAAGAYFGLLLYTRLGSFVPALLGAMVLAGLLGGLIERFVYRPMLAQPRIVALIASIGLFICLSDLFRIIAGPHEKGFDVGITARYQFAGLTVSGIDLLILGGTVVIFGLLALVLRKTRIGFAIRAVAQDLETSRTMGINVNRTVQIVFFIGSAIAAFGGVMIGILYNAVYPTMGDVVSYKGLAIIVIGGFGSLLGAVLAALILGVSETLLTTYTQVPLSREGIAMLLLIILILVRPHGLLGRE